MNEDVITDDFDVEVFLDLLHWSWEDAYKGTHEIERPVSPFSKPVRTISEPEVPLTEPTMSQPERESYEEHSLTLDSHVYCLSEDLGPVDKDESFETPCSTASYPGSCSFSSGQSSPSTTNHDDSPRAQPSNLKRSASSDTHAPAPKRVCRQIRSGLISVTDAELNEPPKKWKVSYDQGPAPCGHNHDFHNSSIADRLSDKKPNTSCDDVSKGRKDSVSPKPNVSWKNIMLNPKIPIIDTASKWSFGFPSPSL